MANFNININSYTCPDLLIDYRKAGPSSECRYYVKLYKQNGLNNYKLFINGVLEPSSSIDTETDEYIEYYLTDTGINEYEIRATATCIPTSETILSSTKSYKPNDISNDTDIYAIFDTTSMTIEDGRDASAALNNWYNEYKQDNFDFNGKLYILPMYVESYVNYPRIIHEGDQTLATGEWATISRVPPNWGNSSYISPKEVLMLGFVDEANSEYHGTTVDFEGQATDKFDEDYSYFVQTLYPQYDFFRGVVYPIVRSITGHGGALVLQLLACMKAKTMRQSEIDAIDTDVDLNVLKGFNPYVSYEPLEDYNWVGVYNKTSPASEVFNSITFNDELNDIIIQNDNNACA